MAGFAAPLPPSSSSRRKKNESDSCDQEHFLGFIWDISIVIYRVWSREFAAESLCALRLQHKALCFNAEYPARVAGATQEGR